LDIYDLLKNKTDLINPLFSSQIFSDEERGKLATEESKKIYDLLKNIYSLSMREVDNGIVFEPFVVFEGKRSFALEDMTEDDYKCLLSLELERLPLSVKTRIADVLWTKKRNFVMGNIAANSYFESFKLAFKDEEWVDSLKLINRAICISAQINKMDLYKKCCNFVYEEIIRIDGKDEHFLSIKLIEILLKQSFGDLLTI